MHSPSLHACCRRRPFYQRLERTRERRRTGRPRDHRQQADECLSLLLFVVVLLPLTLTQSLLTSAPDIVFWNPYLCESKSTAKSEGNRYVPIPVIQRGIKVDVILPS